MRYVIVAPTYNKKTAGIKTLQELQKWLIRSGKDAVIPNININYSISIIICGDYLKCCVNCFAVASVTVPRISRLSAATLCFFVILDYRVG